MSTQPSPSPSPTPYHPRHSQELKPNPHPYAIKTTSTGNLTRSGSVTNKNDRSFYVPSPSPSPTKSATPWNHVEERSGSGRHKYSRSLTGEDEVPKPLPAPPSHPSTVDPGEHATRSNGRPLSWSSANNQPFPQPSFVEGLPTRSRIRADPFSGNGFTFGSGPASAEDDPKAWSAAELAERLDSQADEEVKHFVLENDINGRAFLRLDEGVLNAYGITSNQYRQLLLDASRTLRQRSLRSRLNRQWPSDASAPDVDGIVRSYEVEEPEDFDDNASVSSASSTSSLRDSFGSDAGPERKKKYRPKPNRGNSRVHGIISSLEETKGIDEAYAHPHRNSTGSIGHGRSRSRSSASGSENGSDVQDQRDRDRENGINTNNSMSGDPFYYPSALAAAGGRPLPSPPPGPYMDPVKQTHTGSSSGSLPMSSFDFGVGGGATASMGMGMGGGMLEPNPVGAALPSSPSKSPSRRPLPETPMHPSLRSPPPLSPEEEEDPFGVKDHDGAHTEMTMDQLLDMLEADNKKESVAGANPFESMNPLETVKGVPSAPPSIFASIEGNTPTKRGSGHNRSASGRSVSGKLGEELSASSTSKRSKPRSMRRVEGSYTSASSLFSAVEDIYASTSPSSPPAATSPASSPPAPKDAKPTADVEEEELSMEDLLAREEAKTAGKGGLAAWFSDGGDGKARVETVKRVPAASIVAPVALPAASAPATVNEEHGEEPSRSQLPTPPPSELAISHLTRASEDSGYIVVDHTDDEHDERKAFEDALDTTYHKLKKQTDETRMLADEMRKRLADLEGKVTAMEDEQREKEQIRKEKEATAAAGNEFISKFYAQMAALFGAERPTSTSAANAKSTPPGASSSKDGASSAAVPHQRTPTIMCKTYTRFMLGVGLCAVVLVLRSVLFATKTGRVNVGRGWWLLRGLLGSSSTGTVRR